MSEICLLCESSRVKVLTHEMRLCRDCGFFFVAPAERARQQAEFNLVSGKGVDQEHLEKLRKKYPKDNHQKKFLYQRLAKRVAAWYGPSVRVLDVGASGGFFLNAVEQEGASPTALRDLEIDPVYLELAKEYFGYEGDISNIETYQPALSFNVVAMFDVLEHVDNFWLALKNINTMLTPDGRLILKLPNANWTKLKYHVSMWLRRPEKVPFYLYLEPGGHLNYWNHQSIKKLEKAGFVVESFEYVQPTKQQFGKQYWLRNLAYQLDRLLGTNLFPEFVVILKKVAPTQDS